MRLSPRLHRSFIETRPKSASRNRTFLFIRLTGREAPTDICLHFGSPPHCILTRPHGTVSHVSLRSFARQSSPSAAVVGDPVPGRLCSRYSHAMYPCNRHCHALGFCVVSSCTPGAALSTLPTKFLPFTDKDFLH